MSALAPAIDLASSGLTLTKGAGSLVVRFTAEERVVSWAIVGGGLRNAPGVVWIQVKDEDLRPPVDARSFLRERLADCEAAGAVGLLTSRIIDHYADVTCTQGDASARCVATVGLGNALRVGDPPGPTGRIGARVGTINLLCRVSVPLTDDALLEAMSIATEARTAAILEANVESRRTGARATGTGTDCIVVAAPIPLSIGAPREPYAGKHTRVGHLVGAAVLDAVTRAASQWKSERGLV